MQARLLPLSDVDDRLLGQWRELTQHCLEPNPFFDPGMTLNAAALPGAPPVSLLLVHDSERLHLLAPVSRERRYRRLPVPALTTWRHDYSLLGTPLVSPEDPVAALGEAVRLLRRDAVAPWWVLEGMSADGPVAAAMEEMLQSQSLHATRFLTHKRGAIMRHRDEDHPEDSISVKSLRSLRRKRRRLSDALGEDVRTIDATSLDLDAAIEGFLRAEAGGWKGQDGGAFLCRPGHADFFRAVCNDFAAQGRLQLYTLGTSDESVAYQCNLLAQDRAFRFKIAYDEDYRRFSPGALLDLDTVATFRTEDELKVFDSCTSPEDEAVLQFFTDSIAITTLLVPLSGVRGRVAARATPAVTAAGRRIRQWQQGLGEARWERRP